LDLIGRKIKDRHPHAEPAASLQSGKEYYTIVRPLFFKANFRMSSLCQWTLSF
jgi:hypothetical protein